MLSGRNISVPVKRIYICLMILFCIGFAANEIIAQNNPISELTRCKYAFQNLKMALSSDNRALKQSAIFLVGKYRIAEGEIILEEMLLKEKDPCTKILITLVLLELNEAKGFNALGRLNGVDRQDEVIRSAAITFYEHMMNDLHTVNVK